VRDATHPIIAGPPMWMHQGDKLYAPARAGKKMTVLATAFSDPASKGTGGDGRS
jgi:hypothetical protein